MKTCLRLSGLDSGCYARRISSLLCSLLGMVWMMGCSEGSNGMDERLEFGLITRSSDIEITDSCIVTLVTAKQDVSFWQVIANGDIMVDWGDGSFDMNHYAHTYTDGMTHTIKFYGSPTALISLSCNDLEATELIVKGNLVLQMLACGMNNLTELDVTSLINLTRLECTVNQILELNVDNNLHLISLMCMKNRLMNLNISNNIDLVELNFSDNMIDTISLENNKKLWSLGFDNTLIRSLNIENNSQLASISAVCTPMIFNQLELMSFANSLPSRIDMESGWMTIDKQFIYLIQEILGTKNWICAPPYEEVNITND